MLDSAERALALFRAVDDEVGQAFALNAVGLGHLELVPQPRRADML